MRMNFIEAIRACQNGELVSRAIHRNVSDKHSKSEDALYTHYDFLTNTGRNKRDYPKWYRQGGSFTFAPFYFTDFLAEDWEICKKQWEDCEQCIGAGWQINLDNEKLDVVDCKKCEGKGKTKIKVQLPCPPLA